MSELFLKIMNMSLSASWLVLAVLLLRFVFRKAPKWVNVLLWGIVAVRLICPFSIESALSLIPSAEVISPSIMMDATPSIQTGIPAINNAVNPVIGNSFSPAPGDSANPLQIWIPILSILWVAGVTALLLYTLVSYCRLRRRVREAVILQGNIYQSENVGSPFVLGIIKPKIYLPYHMDGDDLPHVIAHEQAHIRRRDHWWKPLGFLLLTIHWFNPLMWLAYVLLCRDIELACDEKVIKDLGSEQRADYTQALLTCSVNRRMVAACPLAFGEVGVKERVKSVMNYKKPSFWVIVLAVIACVVIAVCFLTNPTPYTEEIMIDGNIYIRQSWEIHTLPDGSSEIGMLQSVVHKTHEHPQEDFSGVNLDEKYPGNMLFQSGNDPDTVYLEDLSGYYIPFSKNPFSSQEIAKLVGSNTCKIVSIQPVSLIVLQSTSDSGLVNVTDQEQISGFLDLLKTTEFKKTAKQFSVVPDTLAADITLENDTGAFIRILMLSAPYRDEYSIYVRGSNGYYLEAANPEALSNYIVWLVKNGLDDRPKAERIYIYEEEGFGGKFSITLNSDGSFSYYEGLLSSYIGMGAWKREGDILTLTDYERNNKAVFVNHFKYDGDDLLFIEKGSSNFMYVTVKNEERFCMVFSSERNNSIEVLVDDIDDFVDNYDEPQLSPSAFVFDGVVYDLAEGSPSVNAVMGYEIVGDYIIAEGHVGPYNAVYGIINTKTQKAEKYIAGANLTWHSDDINTSVYSFWSDVCAFDGTVLASIDLASNGFANTEYISNLSFSDDFTQIKVEISSDDGTIRTETVDIPA